MVYLAFNNSFESPPSSAARGDARQREASRGGKHEGRKRVVYRSSDFFSISFFFSNFPSPPFNLCRFAVSSSVYSKRAILESGTGKQVTRKFCDVPEKRLTSPRDIRTRKFLLFSNLSLSLSRTVKDIFVEHCLLRLFLRAALRDLETRWLKSWMRAAQRKKEMVKISVSSCDE